MWRLVWLGIIFGFLFLSYRVTYAQTNPFITLESIDVEEGESIISNLILSSASDGVSGYSVKITIPDILVIQSVDVVEIGIENITINSNDVHIVGVDLDRVIESGDTDIVLATFIMSTIEHGEDNVIIDVVLLHDDFGNDVIFNIVNGSVKIARLFPILPGQTERVADIFGDGLAEDLNGNGRMDFMDIRLLFDHMGSQEVLDNIDLFDYNFNGVIDFDDVIGIFDHMLDFYNIP